jgi:ElaB/YqjD/DUF883 family membrane-anchored ribosome-binding protein
MAEPLRHTSDFPDFDTYPGEGRAQERTLGNRARQLPEGSMVAAAERVGRTVGVAVSTARNLPERLGEVKSRLQLVKDRSASAAGQRASEWAERAGARATEIKDNAMRVAQDQLRAAQDRLLMARQKARRVANDYPLHVIAVVAGAAFLLGVGLRIWRGNRG